MVDYVPIPQEIVQTNKYLMLTADVMFVNNLQFDVTFGQGIGLIMADFTPTHTATHLACNLNRIITVYARAGFVVQTIVMKTEFNKVMVELPEVVTNTSEVQEHVAAVEHMTRVIKEQCRVNLTTMPFKFIQTS